MCSEDHILPLIYALSFRFPNFSSLRYSAKIIFKIKAKVEMDAFSLTQRAERIGQVLCFLTYENKHHLLVVLRV